MPEYPCRHIFLKVISDDQNSQEGKKKKKARARMVMVNKEVGDGRESEEL